VKRILVVDDNADMRYSLQALLELEGYAVRTAGNGREALAEQRSTHADVLVTDLFMPESDGFEAIDAFRREFPDTRIIAVSGGGKRLSNDYLATADLLGVDATLEKPLDVDALLRMLRDLT
jgi:CheY-like chemotaxis protein